MLGIVISKINGIRSREVIRSVFHPIQGRGWDYSVSETVRDYALGVEPPRYPVPALKTKVEYIFGFGLADGIFVMVEDYIVLGAYRDGQPLLGCPTIP